ncbi:MAG: NAD-dependent deacetylase [Deltaproteobacteria bacterium]|nr:NAD-dependent deacetylase [Deltaproteobacteria bacterium]
MAQPSLTPEIKQARVLIQDAQKVCVLTGAGISTDSGIPDFRGPNGVWTKDPEAEKMSTLSHYMSEPDVRRRSWQMKLEQADAQRQPNAGHRALVELERQQKLLALVTQNVDGLHHDAGSDPERIVEIHGTLREVVCMECDERADMERALRRVRAGEEDPACRSCGGILKSATISFGQGLVERDMVRAESAAQECDLMLAIGTTLGVYPIAGIVPIAHTRGTPVLIVNAEPTEMDALAHLRLTGSISEVLPLILNQN